MLPLYENIKKLRRELNMSQEQLARLTGYTDRSSIARIEKGEIDLPQSKIKQFAEALGTTPGLLMGWVSEETNKKNDELTEIIVEMRKNPEFFEYVSMSMKLSPTEFASMKQILSGLVNK